MAWITPDADLLEEALPAEWQALANAMKKPGNSAAENTARFDRIVARVIEDAVNELRGDIPAAIARGESGTLPVELRGLFLTKARLAMHAQIPGSSVLSDEVRKSLITEMGQTLKALRDGTFFITPDSDSAEAAPAADVPQFYGDPAVLWPGTVPDNSTAFSP